MDLIAALRSWAFVTVSALIMVVTSERVFWYYTDATPLAFAELAVFYSLAVYVLFWFVERHRVGVGWELLVAVPVFGYVVEGVITPVLYAGGPTPFFPVWFSAWHGGLGTLLVWFVLRRLLLDDRRWAVLGVAVGLGLFWGTWATTMWLPENLTDPELAESSPRVRSVADFGRYAAITAGVLVLGHWLLGRGLWIRTYRPSPRVARVVGVLCVAMAVAYSFAYPWAAPMFVGLMAATAWILRRHARDADGPTLFALLDGPVRVRSLVPLAALPGVATATYAAWTSLDPSEAVVRWGVMYGTIAVQTLVAAVAMVWSIVVVLRRSNRRVAPSVVA